MLLSKNKFLRINFNDPKPIARCDTTGFVVMHEDLRPQMEYAGGGLINTGFLVHYKFLDKPNPQNLAPIVKGDPFPVENPRPLLYFDREDEE